MIVDEEEEHKEGRTLMTGATTSLSYTGEGGASVGGASAPGVSMGTFGSRSKSGDGFPNPKLL